jgi:adenylate cyclase
MAQKVLVVDDEAKNIKLLADILTVKGYDVITAASGAEALSLIKNQHPDLVLLDVVMPGITGYEVCQSVRADPAICVLPIILVTALDTSEKIKGLEAGADDFLTKPINLPELLARVHSLLRIKELYDTVQSQASTLAEWNRTLETRVAEQVAQLERLSRLKRFVSPKVGELILAGKVDDPLKTHRREITVVFTDLRGFTAFTETAEPEEVMQVLRDYHDALGSIVMAHDGTVENFAGDSVMILFNDPVQNVDHELAAVRMALALRDAAGTLAIEWKRHGHELGLGIGVANGYATMGTIGFEGRREYGAIGSVCNLAARLCAEAKGGQVLVSQRVFGKIEQNVRTESVGELSLKGFHRPVQTYNVVAVKDHV